jgi:hypothetical protein
MILYTRHDAELHLVFQDSNNVVRVIVAIMINQVFAQQIDVLGTATNHINLNQTASQT